VAAHYGLSSALLASPGTGSWAARADEFLELLCNKSGRLLKGGEPDVAAAAVNVINDFQRGRLPYFSPPPPVVAGSHSVERESAKAAGIVDEEGSGRAEKEREGIGGAKGRADAILGAAAVQSVPLACDGNVARMIVDARVDEDDDFSALVF
jgi:nuclear GTP-binding protein